MRAGRGFGNISSPHSVAPCPVPWTWGRKLLKTVTGDGGRHPGAPSAWPLGVGAGVAACSVAGLAGCGATALVVQAVATLATHRRSNADAGRLRMQSLSAAPKPPRQCQKTSAELLL